METGMAAIAKTANDGGLADEAAVDDLTRLAERHLVQPWPVSGAIGAEARGRGGGKDGDLLRGCDRQGERQGRERGDDEFQKQATVHGVSPFSCLAGSVISI